MRPVDELIRRMMTGPIYMTTSERESLRLYCGFNIVVGGVQMHMIGMGGALRDNHKVGLTPFDQTVTWSL